MGTQNDVTYRMSLAQEWDRFYLTMFDTRTDFANQTQALGGDSKDDRPVLLCVDSRLRTINVLGKMHKMFPSTWPAEMRTSVLLSDPSRPEEIVLPGPYLADFMIAPWDPDQLGLEFRGLGMSVKEGLLWFLFCVFTRSLDILSPLVMLESRFPESSGEVRTGQWIPALKFEKELTNPRMYPVSDLLEFSGTDVYLLKSRNFLE